MTQPCNANEVDLVPLKELAASLERAIIGTTGSRITLHVTRAKQYHQTVLDTLGYLSQRTDQQPKDRP